MSFDEAGKRRLHELAAKMSEGPPSAQTMSHDLTSALRLIEKLEAFRDRACERWPPHGQHLWIEVCEGPA